MRQVLRLAAEEGAGGLREPLFPWGGQQTPPDEVTSEQRWQKWEGTRRTDTRGKSTCKGTVLGARLEAWRDSKEAVKPEQVRGGEHGVRSEELWGAEVVHRQGLAGHGWIHSGADKFRRRELLSSSDR